MGDILDYIPTLVTQGDDDLICRLPSMGETKEAVWLLSPSSSASPDGFNGYFIREAWDITMVDVCKADQEFFVGVPIPKAFGSTLITLIPKTGSVSYFDRFRPICISTFFSKIISRLLVERMKKIVPKLISHEQAAFQEGVGD
ncbi:unnamed protein product [Cuscuta campestris]|uniref:Reverse transcriptase domain-containing protein n=1 Tax=Cuscuta campestris TaxID=132261 RepID=A0A484MU66_9ASTE|nr:unnamed protein product [Cuscuta campestris]